MTPIHPRTPLATPHILLATILCVLARVAAAKETMGHVAGINDGDILTLLTGQHPEVRIRLAEIDTSERGQPCGTHDRRSLSDLARIPPAATWVGKVGHVPPEGGYFTFRLHG